LHFGACGRGGRRAMSTGAAVSSASACGGSSKDRNRENVKTAPNSADGNRVAAAAAGNNAADVMAPGPPNSLSGSHSYAELSTTKALHISLDDNPNLLAYIKMEALVERMQKEEGGVPIKTVKSFMTKIPSVFTGADAVQWIQTHVEVM